MIALIIASVISLAYCQTTYTVRGFNSAASVCSLGLNYEGIGCAIPAANTSTPCNSVVLAGCSAYAPSSSGAFLGNGTSDQFYYQPSSFHSGAANATAGLHNVQNGSDTTRPSVLGAGHTLAGPLVGFVRGSAFLFTQANTDSTNAAIPAIVKNMDYVITVPFCSSAFASASSRASMLVAITNATTQAGITSAGTATASGFAFLPLGTTAMTSANARTAQSALFIGASPNATCGELSVKFFHYELFSQLKLNRYFTIYLLGPGGADTVFYDEIKITATNRLTTAAPCTTIFVNEINFVDTTVAMKAPFKGLLDQIEIAGPVNTVINSIVVSFFNATGYKYLTTTVSEQKVVVDRFSFVAL